MTYNNTNLPNRGPAARLKADLATATPEQLTAIREAERDGRPDALDAALRNIRSPLSRDIQARGTVLLSLKFLVENILMDQPEKLGSKAALRKIEAAVDLLDEARLLLGRKITKVENAQH